jgi:hypothetical protein
MVIDDVQGWQENTKNAEWEGSMQSEESEVAQS